MSLSATDIHVRVCVEDDRASYWFQCPECGMRDVVDLPPRKLALLIDLGVPFDVWTAPAEVMERPGGAPFTMDDLLTFHLMLDGDTWFAECASTPQGHDER